MIAGPLVALARWAARLAARAVLLLLFGGAAMAAALGCSHGLVHVLEAFACADAVPDCLRAAVWPGARLVAPCDADALASACKSGRISRECCAAARGLNHGDLALEAVAGVLAVAINCTVVWAANRALKWLDSAPAAAPAADSPAVDDCGGGAEEEEDWTAAAGDARSACRGVAALSRDLAALRVEVAELRRDAAAGGPRSRSASGCSSSAAAAAAE